MAESEGFQVYDSSATAKMEEFKTESQKPDPIWTERIGPIPVGASFTVNRPNGETVRAFKKRINRASMVHFKTLEWKSKDTNLPDGIEATHWVAKVKALDLKAKAEAEARIAANAQNGSETPQEAAQTTEPENAAQDTSEETTAVGPRRGRQ